MEADLDILGLIGKKIPRNIWVCFWTGIITGWVTHFYMLTHKLPNWDDISQIDGIGLTDEIGRWMLEPFQRIAWKASNPAINGTLLIILLSLAACVIVASLKIETITASVLIPAVLITFPSVTGVLYFMFTAHVYAIGVLLFCLSAFFVQRYKLGFIPSGICIILGLAVYQPFVSFAITLMLMILVKDVIKGDKFKNLIKKGFIYAGTLAGSTLVYILISRAFFLNVEKEKYGGVNEMGKLAIAEIPKNFGRVYKRVLEYFITKPFAYVTVGMHRLNIILCFSVLALFIICVVQRKLWKRKLELAFACIIAFLIPFGMGFVYFMAPDAPFSTLMLYAYSLFYVLIVSLAEDVFSPFEDTSAGKESGKNVGFKIVGASAVSILIALVVYGNYLLDSQAYFRSSIAVERVTNYYNRIISSIESTDGYQIGDRVAILGEFYYATNPSVVETRVFDNDEGYRELGGVVLENGLITTGVRNDFIRTYVGFNPGHVSNDEMEALVSTNEFKAMPTYPSEGSIARIGDVWVVKLCE